MDKRLFQLHLERIADYLSIGEGKRWHHDEKTNENIFHDVSDSSPDLTQPLLLSFYDTAMKEARQVVKLNNLQISP